MASFRQLLTSPCLPVLISMFLESVSFVGTIKVVGVLFEDMSISLNMTLTEFGLSLGIFSLFDFLPAPFILIAYRKVKFPYRVPLVLGAVMASMGLILASFATSTWHMTMCLAMAAFGLCILDLYLTMALMEELTDNFNILLCLASSGCAVGMVLSPLIAEVLNTAYGWRGALLIIGALMANIVPCVLFIRIRNTSEDRDELGSSQAGNSVHGTQEASDPKGECTESSHAMSRMCSRDSVSYGDDDDSFPCNESNSSSEELSTSLLSRKCHTQNARSGSPARSHMKASELPVRNPKGTSKKCNHEQQRADCDDENDDGDDRNLRYDSYINWENGSRSGAEQVRCGNRLMEKTTNVIEVFRTTPFYTDPWGNLVYICAVVLGFVYTGWHAFLVPHALGRGISPYNVLIITSFAALGNLSGRVLAGILTNSLVSPASLVLMLSPVNSLFLFGYAYVTNQIAMSVMACVSALAITGRIKLPLLVGKGRTSADKYHLLFGALQVTLGTGLLLGGFISGLVIDRLSSYDAAFKLLAGVEVGVFCLMLPLKLLERH